MLFMSSILKFHTEHVKIIWHLLSNKYIQTFIFHSIKTHFGFINFLLIYSKCRYTHLEKIYFSQLQLLVTYYFLAILDWFRSNIHFTCCFGFSTGLVFAANLLFSAVSFVRLLPIFLLWWPGLRCLLRGRQGPEQVKAKLRKSELLFEVGDARLFDVAHNLTHEQQGRQLLWTITSFEM